MRNRKVLLVAVAIAASLAALAVVVLETAFFHVNPIKFGFNRFDFGRYMLLTKQSVPDPEFGTLSDIMSLNEKAVSLTYKSKVQIILCEKQSDMDRYQPFASAANRRNAVGFAPWPNTIYITPKMKEKYGTAQGMLGHELSHILLIQNYGIIKATVLWKRAEWIPEGFATYLNNWPDYFERTELPKRIVDSGVVLTKTQFPPGSQMSRISLPLRYMIYRFFVEYLYESRPSATVVQFLKEAYDHPLRMEAIFKRVLGKSLDDFWRGFWTSLIPEGAG